MPGNGTTPGQAMRRGERLDRLESALGNLSPDQRQVIRLTRFEGCSLKETARRMNRTPAAVGQLLSRALRKLRESFVLGVSMRDYEKAVDGVCDG